MREQNALLQQQLQQALQASEASRQQAAAMQSPPQSAAAQAAGLELELQSARAEIIRLTEENHNGQAAIAALQGQISQLQQQLQSAAAASSQPSESHVHADSCARRGCHMSGVSSFPPIPSSAEVEELAAKLRAAEARAAETESRRLQLEVRVRDFTAARQWQEQNVQELSEQLSESATR